MLLQFTVGNFKSFKDKVTLSMEATADDWREEDNVTQLEKPKLRLLKTAAIYGANASGKSNLIEAMVRFRTFVLGSSKDSQKGDPIPVAPFRLSTETEGAPTFFEVVFLKDGTRYRYGFEATTAEVVSEWLFEQKESIRETKLFTRLDYSISTSAAYKEGKGLEDKTRTNALYLSVVAQFNGKIAGEVMTWISQLGAISGLRDAEYAAFTLQLLQQHDYRRAILEFTREGDRGIVGIFLKDFDETNFREASNLNLHPRLRELIALKPPSLERLRSTYQRFGPDDEPDGIVEFNPKTEWSEGTGHLFALSGPFLHSLQEGTLLVVDELDARLHPLLTKNLVELFNTSANLKGAQLIFATHDSGLLDHKGMRRDQVWFVEKDSRGVSDLFSLADFKGIRKDANFRQEYLLGQFGGVPRAGELFESAVAHVEK